MAALFFALGWMMADRRGGEATYRDQCHKSCGFVGSHFRK